MPVNTPQLIVEAFAINGEKTTIPVASQIGIVNGAASYNDGFPPLTRLSPSSGGVPPSGKEFNGILFAATSYCSYIQGGGQFRYSLTFSTANSGYAIGAVMQSAVSPEIFYLNTVAGNTNDPDVTLTGWLPYSVAAAPTKVQTLTAAAGAQVVAISTGTGLLQVDVSAGDATLTNLTGAKDGQTVLIQLTAGANLLTLQTNSNIRLAADLSLLLNDSISLRYFASISKWIKV